MNGEGRAQESTSSNKQQNEHSDHRRTNDSFDSDGNVYAGDNLPPSEGNSSSGAGGDGNQPRKPNYNHIDENVESEDDNHESDESGDFGEEESGEEETFLVDVEGDEHYEKVENDEKVSDSEDNAEYTPNLALLAETVFDVPVLRGRGHGRGRGRGRGSGRGRGRGRGRGHRRGTGRGISRIFSGIRRPRKPRGARTYLPSEMVRREHQIKEESSDSFESMSQSGFLQSVSIKKEDSSWDREVAETLKNVIKSANQAKKYKAVGRPRKRPLDAHGSSESKAKTGITAYPIVQVKKISENDWDAEEKYSIPGFCCNDCGAVYQSTAALRRHQNYECGKEPQFKCNECDYAAKHKGTLKSHIKNRHLPKGFGDDLPKRPRKPRTPRVSFPARAPSPI